MEFDTDVVTLSKKFYAAYPSSSYPEILYKSKRAYNCLLIDVHSEYFVCIPYRSHILHSHAFLFKSSKRSKRTRSGLDYSKMVIIKNQDYISNQSGVIDQDEYAETMRNIDRIAAEAVAYLELYVNHKSGKVSLNSKQFQRHFGCSTLPYFDSELGIALQPPKAV